MPIHRPSQIHSTVIKNPAPDRVSASPPLFRPPRDRTRLKKFVLPGPSAAHRCCGWRKAFRIRGAEAAHHIQLLTEVNDETTQTGHGQRIDPAFQVVEVQLGQTNPPVQKTRRRIDREPFVPDCTDAFLFNNAIASYTNGILTALQENSNLPPGVDAAQAPLNR